MSCSQLCPALSPHITRANMSADTVDQNARRMRRPRFQLAFVSHAKCFIFNLICIEFDLEAAILIAGFTFNAEAVILSKVSRVCAEMKRKKHFKASRRWRRSHCLHLYVSTINATTRATHFSPLHSLHVEN